MLFALALLAATDPDAAHALDRIEVSAARVRGVQAFDLPASVSRVDLRAAHQGAGTTIASALGGIPGLAARDRQNHAQDTQLSVRGFGARSTFGVRGLRIYIDGIPATMPDGQGQVSHFALATARRVDVLRGPFSALHGNSSGGVIELWSDDDADPGFGAQFGAGRDASLTTAADGRGGNEARGYHLSASQWRSDGFRDHGAARRAWYGASWHAAVGDNGRLALRFQHFDAPEAQDPLGLTRAQAEADPGQAIDAARLFDTRKSVGQNQFGLRVEQALGTSHALQLTAHAGTRRIEQFLAVPVSAQANPLHAGGVVDLHSRQAGSDARWIWQGELLGGESEFAVGGEHQAQHQQRRGYENFLDATLGVRGALRRDERNRVANTDFYAQWWWRVAPRWSLLAGLRRSRVKFRSDDAYVTAANPDDSGRISYRETTPVAGLGFAPHANLRLYASQGRGFETPTFNELGYRADGGAGLAFDLRAARSEHLELGAKWRSDAGARIETAWFRADTDDELAVARNLGGRSSFRNVGRARRSGVELGLHWPWHENLALELAYTRLDARFREAFPVCAGPPCTSPAARVAAGTRIPGTARDQLFTRLQWTDAPWQAALEMTASGPIGVNDLGSERAPGHALWHLELARTWQFGGGQWRASARLENLLDASAIGSVIVNEASGRYYEPAAGRGLWLGAQWHWRP
jgi:iron complex outermembrane receptor protein